MVYRELGETERALPILEELYNLTETKLGPNHPETFFNMLNLTILNADVGKYDEAFRLSEKTYNRMKTTLGPDHPNTLTAMNHLAMGYQTTGQSDKALALFEEILNLRKAKLGAEPPSTLNTMSYLAAGYRATGKLDLALPLFEETLKLIRAKLGADPASTLSTMSYLGRAYCDAQQGEKAASRLKEFVTRQRKPFPNEHPQFAGLLRQVSLALLKCEQFPTAEEMLRESLKIPEKKEAEAWTTSNTMSMLGGTLLGQKKYADAEPLLLKSYEGMKAREKMIPPEGTIRIAEALGRLIALYKATNKPDEVKKYRELWAKIPEPTLLPKEKP